MTLDTAIAVYLYLDRYGMGTQWSNQKHAEAWKVIQLHAQEQIKAMAEAERVDE